MRGHTWSATSGLTAYSAPAVQLLVYVDGVLVAETSTGDPTPHLLINQLCEGQTSESDPGASQALGFRLELPPLQHGRHQVRVEGFDLNGGSSGSSSACCIDV